MSKITIIGAGSVEFTVNIVADLCAYDELHGTVEISLHDIDEERLVTAERAATLIISGAGAGYRVAANLDRRVALANADYAINEIQVGGYQATLTDFEIPKKYGLRQTIADTIGIGGIFRGLRTIPVMLGIGNDMAEVCPDALLLNYTNPMAMVPWAVYAGTPFTNVVGVCHSVRDTHTTLAGIVGVPESEIAFTTAGFNHQAFVLRFEHARTHEDLYPRLRAAIAADPDGLGRRVRVEIFERFGYFPTESSEHSSEYVPWFIRHDDQLERFRILIDDYISRSDENLEAFERTKAALHAGEPLELEQNDELASQIVRAMETGVAAQVYGNVRNDGLLDDLPPDCCVEVPCFAGTGGVKPVRIGHLPPQLAALNRTFLNVAELTVHAALEQERDLVYQAALLDPNTAATLTIDQTVRMCDDMIAAHGDLIPEGIRR